MHPGRAFLRAAVKKGAERLESAAVAIGDTRESDATRLLLLSCARPKTMLIL